MEEDIQNHLPTVMFRGTPCIMKDKKIKGRNIIVSISKMYFPFLVCGIMQ